MTEPMTACPLCDALWRAVDNQWRRVNAAYRAYTAIPHVVLAVDAGEADRRYHEVRQRWQRHHDSHRAAERRANP